MSQELMPCGTRAAYERHRVRGEPIDEACRMANREVHAALRGTVPPRHGLSGYMNYGCLCEVCSAAGARRNRAWREAQRGARE